MTTPSLRTAADFPPEVLRLFDQYVHNLIDRRGFLEGAARYAASGLTAAAFLEALTPRFAEAQQVAPTDRRLHAEHLPYPSPHGNARTSGYLVRPAGPGKHPAVLVVHENRGLNPHIEDIARRVALEGFVAFAPDALAPLGGYPGDEDEAREAFAKLDQAKTREDMLAAAAFVRARPESTGRLGVVGFCWGGGIANFLATKLPPAELAAAVPFYGMAPPADAVSAIKAPLLLHFAEHDERINAAWPAYEQALKAAHARHEAHVYPGTQHGFNNDTTPRYDASAAKLAWQRTIAFFGRELRR
jgi:carboxymethylenebutenolidase